MELHTTPPKWPKIAKMGIFAIWSHVRPGLPQVFKMHQKVAFYLSTTRIRYKISKIMLKWQNTHIKCPFQSKIAIFGSFEGGVAWGFLTIQASKKHPFLPTILPSSASTSTTSQLKAETSLFSTNTPTHHPTEKVVNHVSSEHFLHLLLLSTRIDSSPNIATLGSILDPQSKLRSDKSQSGI